MKTLKPLLLLCMVLTVMGAGNAFAIPDDSHPVPDYSSTSALLGTAMLGLTAVRRWIRRS
jgi:hypothetical protein